MEAPDTNKNGDMVVIKGHEFVHISNQVSITQRKLMNVLLYNAYDSLLTQEIHSITISTLLDLMDYETNNYDFLKEAFRGLVDVKFEWNLLGPKGDKWGIATALAQAEIEGNVCKYSYAPKVREKLFNPEIYAQIDLRIQGKFKSNYALALYENCSRFRSLKKTTWISLPVLRQLLGVPDTSYRDEFKIFNREVIKPSVASVNEISNILIEAEFQRENRKVVAIRFLIADRHQALPDLTESDNEVDPAIVLRLQDFGLSEKNAKTEGAVHSAEYITSVLDYVEAKVAEGKVKDIPAYTVRALKEGWMLHDTKFARSKREREEFDKRSKDYEREMANIKEAFSDYRKSRIAQIREELSGEDLEDLRSEFLSVLEPHERDILKRSGFDSSIIQARFNSYIAGKFLTKPEEMDIDAFIKFSGFDVPEPPVLPKTRAVRQKKTPEKPSVE